MSSELVLGIDSSTQSTKAVLVEADTGRVVDEGASPHPTGTAVDPRAWLSAFDDAGQDLLPRAGAVSVGGQQHGMVALDHQGVPVYDALLWNDTRSAPQAAALIAELGGADACAERVGSVLVASMTSTKLRWLRDHEPEAAARVHRVLLPHDYVSHHLAGGDPFTDHGDASGTGYYSTQHRAWLPELAGEALGHEVALPELLGPSTVAGHTSSGAVVAPGTGDNMAAALGLGLQQGDVVVSIGTSGVASTMSTQRVADGTGAVTGFADATGHFLPLIATMNAARILDLQCSILGVDHDTLGRLALDSVPGAHGVTVLPYYDGERSPNRPEATGVWSGMTTSTTREDLARAAIEGLLCSLGEAIDRLTATTGTEAQRILLIGGAAANAAVQQIAPAIWGAPVTVPQPAEYVALGAARQAAWTLSGSAQPPAWTVGAGQTFDAEPTPEVREAYALLREHTSTWP